MHSGKYVYSKVVFVNTKTKVVVVCPEHGDFEVTPDNHLRGSGCPKCARQNGADNLRKTTSQFIAEARSVHGDRFDYSLVDYRQAREKVAIICPDHGFFLQGAGEHLSGKGCRKCADVANALNTRGTTEDFIASATEKFGGKFDYSLTKYETAWTPVDIVCPDHGKFSQAAVNHLVSKHGCPECASRATNLTRQIKTAEFLVRATDVHGDRYDYSEVQCENSKTRVRIACKSHGVFEQAAGEHLSGKGCPKCGNDSAARKRQMTLAEFIRRAEDLHGSKYDYSLVTFKSVADVVTIICPVHGEFEQSAWSHLSGGCRKCADENLPGRYTKKILDRDPLLSASPAILYYLRFWSNTETFYKIGITTTTVRKRYAGYAATGYQYEILNELKTSLAEAYSLEQEILRAHGKPNAYKPKNWIHAKARGGRSECFGIELPDVMLQLFK